MEAIGTDIIISPAALVVIFPRRRKPGRRRRPPNWASANFPTSRFESLRLKRVDYCGLWCSEVARSAAKADDGNRIPQLGEPDQRIIVPITSPNAPESFVEQWIRT